jgi:hypothetical protein
MNLKLATQLRAAAQYRNQSATPGVTPFPGIHGMVRHPVYASRVTTKTTYERKSHGWTKVLRRERHPVVDRWGKGVLEMQSHPVGTLPTAFEDGQPVAFNQHVVMRPKEHLVPVTKPVRLDPTCAKGKYRALKRLARKGLLLKTGAAIINSLKGVPA